MDIFIRPVKYRLVFRVRRPPHRSSSVRVAPLKLQTSARRPAEHPPSAGGLGLVSCYCRGAHHRTDTLIVKHGSRHHYENGVGFSFARPNLGSWSGSLHPRLMRGNLISADITHRQLGVHPEAFGSGVRSGRPRRTNAGNSCPSSSCPFVLH